MDSSTTKANKYFSFQEYFQVSQKNCEKTCLWSIQENQSLLNSSLHNQMAFIIPNNARSYNALQTFQDGKIHTQKKISHQYST